MGLFETTPRGRRRLVAIATAAALALGSAACGDDEGDDTNAQTGGAATTEPAKQPEAPAAEVPLVSGTTTLVLADTIDRVLDTAGVEVRPTGDATRADGGGIEFPVTGGGIERGTVQGRIVHGGGLEFVAAGRSVEATDLVINTKTETLTADVGDQRGIDLLSLDMSDVERHAPGSNIRATGIEATLGSEAADTLNEALGVSVLQGGVPLGELSISGDFRREGG